MFGPTSPLFFERNRVARLYRGGALFHEFFGDPAEDGLKPEEWVASSVRALNRDCSDPLEGVSLIEGTGEPFNRFIERNPGVLGGRKDLGILVKVLHSSVRLPVQAHPDKAFARKHFQSNHGKTEMWLVLATGEDAKVHFGFRQPIERARFLEAISDSETNRDAMCSLLNDVSVMPGDVFLVPPRMVHAIGADCLILEIQEPTDFTIQPEAWCGDYRLTDYEMYMGLDPEVAVECFDLQDVVGQKAVEQARIDPLEIHRTGARTVERLVAEEHTPDFSVYRHSIAKGSGKMSSGPSVFVIVGGSGTLVAKQFRRDVSKGSYFFQPSGARDVVVETDTEVTLIECLPGRPPVD